jgi:hypothetical protein
MTYFYSIITIFVSIFTYFFCNYISESSKFLFNSKKNKIKNNSHKIINFNNNISEVDQTCIIHVPKYFIQSNILYFNNIDCTKSRLLKLIDSNEKISTNSINAFLNNKFILSCFCKKIDIFNPSNFLDIVCNFQYPINIILKFYNNDNYVLFYLQNNTIIKITNNTIYNNIIDSIFNSSIFIICHSNNKYISNGTIINHKINKNIIYDIFKNTNNNKYYNFLNKFDNMAIILFSSTNCNL